MEPKSICHCRGSPGPTSWCSALICSRICLRTSRSEEHTSELQSLRHLVCRLLLEKKKKKFLTTGSKAAWAHSYDFQQQLVSDKTIDDQTIGEVESSYGNEETVAVY